jgi:hypothetical protein
MGASMIRMKQKDRAGDGERSETEAEIWIKEVMARCPASRVPKRGDGGTARTAAGGVFVGWVKTPDGTSIPCRCLSRRDPPTVLPRGPVVSHCLTALGNETARQQSPDRGALFFYPLPSKLGSSATCPDLTVSQWGCSPVPGRGDGGQRREPGSRHPLPGLGRSQSVTVA